MFKNVTIDRTFDTCGGRLSTVLKVFGLVFRKLRIFMLSSKISTKRKVSGKILFLKHPHKNQPDYFLENRTSNKVDHKFKIIRI